MAKFTLSNVLLSLMLAATVVLTGFAVGPVIETRFFPVYGRFEPATIEPVDGGSLATFRYEKRRRCAPAGFAWFAGEFGATSKRVDVEAQGRTSEPRPLGWHVTVPYLFLGIAPNEVRSNMRAEIYSRCHGLWVTRTEIYP